uniref:Insulin-like peptide 03 n=1 Tax=Exaiptasia diaphana TaxID=2652724 RepID=INS3_EXADI
MLFYFGLAVIFLIDSSQTQTLYKVNEVGGSQVDRNLCGSDIPTAIKDICGIKKRQNIPRKYGRDPNNILEKEEFAKRFLRVRRQTTDIVEECCVENCAIEEIAEYC